MVGEPPLDMKMPVLLSISVNPDTSVSGVEPSKVIATDPVAAR